MDRKISDAAEARSAQVMHGLPSRCVSVIIAAWNRESTIAKAVASALAEPEVHSVIVVDDASSDGTASKALAADDGSGRLHVLRMPENRGPAAARNLALRLCEAPWVAVLDGDDYFRPGRFATLLALADGWDLVADDIMQIQEDRAGLDEPRPMLASEGPFEPWRCDFKTFVLGNITRGRDRKELGLFKPIMSRAFLEDHRLAYNEDLRLGEDYALYTRALAAGARFRIVPAAGYVSVLRPGSLSGSHSKQDLERLRDFDLTLAGLEHLSAEERAAIREHYHSLDARVQWLEVIEAVKARSVRRFVKAYSRSRTVSRFLSARLAEQLYHRTARRFRPLLWSGAQ
jgi:succinoglycan biosynthesis protein ExoU